MAFVDTQSIPSGLLYLYQGALGMAAEWTKKNYVKKRQPWRINKMQGGGLVTPSLLRGWGVTAEQYYVRRIFQRAAYYFNWQPDTGGAVPPAIGPRNKSWWWTASKDSGMIYRNYFMQQTILSLLDGIIPDWCQVVVGDDAHVTEEFPDRANWNNEILILDSRTAGQDIWVYIKTPYTGYYIYLKPTTFDPWPYTKNMATIQCYATTAGWDEATITWNNKPAVGALLAEFPMEQLGWAFSILPPEAPAIVLKLKASGQYTYFTSSESAAGWARCQFAPLEGYFGI